MLRKLVLLFWSDSELLLRAWAGRFLKMRLICKGAMLVAFFPVMASNIYWGRLDLSLGCLFALAVGAIVGRLIKRSMVRRAHAEMRSLYGSEWGTDS
ncbi:hypothetical protein [Bradyrhizobium iriomotense]|nr:hypothetical protein [Bradyrhizobium iriomotense]